MTDNPDNMDEFDQEQFDSMDEPEHKDVKQKVAEAWRNKPLFKLLVIMGVVGVAIAGALGAFSGTPPIQAARIGKAPNLNEAPGGASSPFFIEQNKAANEQRVQQAINKGESAIPTPNGANIDLADLTDKNKKDPLLEFRAETERLKQEMRAEQKLNAQQLQMMQQQMSQKSQEEDDSLARAMQRQMQELMQSWIPHKLTTVQGVAPKEEKASDLTLATTGAPQAAVGTTNYTQQQKKPIISAGTVNYAQLLTEANSDVPGPILIQILSGPLAGARAVGRFQVMNDYLVLTFNIATLKGKEYQINALALDPDTTLGGMATEVDHRYFVRVLLPAAASFMSAFGSALSQGSSTTTVQDNAVVVDQAQKGYKDATFAGLGQAGQTMSQFFQNQANQIKTLVRVAVGTPMGLFFLTSVYDNQDQQRTYSNMVGNNAQNLQALLAQGYVPGNATGMNGANGYTNGTGTSDYSSQTGYATQNPYQTSPYSTVGVMNQQSYTSYPSLTAGTGLSNTSGYNTSVNYANSPSGVYMSH